MKHSRLESFDSFPCDIIKIIVASSDEFQSMLMHLRLSCVSRQQRAYFEASYPLETRRRIMKSALDKGLIDGRRALVDIFAVAAGRDADWFWSEALNEYWRDKLTESLHRLGETWSHSYDNDHYPSLFLFVANSETMHMKDKVKSINKNQSMLPASEKLALLSTMLRLFEYRDKGRIAFAQCETCYPLSRIMIYDGDDGVIDPRYAAPLLHPLQGEIDIRRLKSFCDLDVIHGRAFVVQNLTVQYDYSSPGRRRDWFDISDAPARLHASRLFERAVNNASKFIDQYPSQHKL